METTKRAIEDWLSKDEQSRNYREGYTLFCQYSSNRSLHSYLGRKQVMSKLVYELEKLVKRDTLSSPKQAVQQVEATIKWGNAFSGDLKPERVEITVDGKVKLEDLPESLQTMYKLNTEAYKLMRAVHEKLKQAKTDGQRKEYRAQLEKYDDAIAERWSHIDAYLEDGTLPEEPAAITTELTVQDVQKHRTAISRTLVVLEGEALSEENRAKAVEKLAERYGMLVAGGQGFDPETVERLKKFGVGK